jgi:dCTP deaminase
MMMSPEEPDRLEALIAAERERLSKLPHFTKDSDDQGVLLSDRIEHYYQKGQLISPMEPDCLRPAGYDLRVGRKYAIGGVVKTLETGETITIHPYQVAVIQTLETLNMPNFLIGRWNIRVSLAYDGLLWVGGAQVDPGFQGRLSCPIYNLSNQKVELKYKDKLAMIDFITTTPPTKASRPFKLKKFIFEEYSTALTSGVEAQLKTFRDESTGLRTDIGDMQRRADTFVTLVFTVVAVLFAGLGIIATKGPNEPSFLNSPVWVAAIALYFAVRANIEPRRESSKRVVWIAWFTPAVLALVVTGLVVSASLFFEAHRSQVAATELERSKEEVTRAKSALIQAQADFGKQIQESQKKSEADLAVLREQIRMLQAKKK